MATLTTTLRTAPATHPRRARRPSYPTASLFPIVPPQRGTEPSRPAGNGLVGIARLAATSPRADARRDVEYFLLPVRSILNRCDSERVPFDWTINPYRGCEFACRYCYARYTHEFMELDTADFEKKIFVKRDPGPVVSRDLDRLSQPPNHIAIGTATDPYQPAERQFGATRAILEQLARREGLSISITTKSNQVLRDLDLLKRIASRSALYINLTVTTLRPRLARLLEPRAPHPDLRLAAVRALADADLRVGVFAMPILPGLTDRDPDLENLVRAARDAGAGWFGASVLFLMPSAARQFLPFLEEKFPKLARQYRDFYSRSAYAPEPYRRQMADRVARLRAKYGLASRPYTPEAFASTSPQLPLALAPASAVTPRADSVSPRYPSASRLIPSEARNPSASGVMPSAARNLSSSRRSLRSCSAG